MAKIDHDTRTFLRESFAEDMSEAQRRKGLIPTPEENEDLVRPVFERIERESASAVPSEPVPVPERRTEYQAEKTAVEMGMSFDPDANGVEQEGPEALGETARFYYERLSERVQLLMGLRERGPLGAPSWRDRLQAAFFTFRIERASGTPEHLNPGFGELVQVLAESNAYFGDWRKPPERKIYSP